MDKSVENPTTPEIYDVVQKIIKLPAEIEVGMIALVLVVWNGMEWNVLLWYLERRRRRWEHRFRYIYVQRKRHPRDWMYLGRVRVQLKDSESGELLHKDIPSSAFGVWFYSFLSGL